MPEFGAVVVPLEPGTAVGGFLSAGEDTAGGGARGIDGGGAWLDELSSLNAPLAPHELRLIAFSTAAQAKKTT